MLLAISFNVEVSIAEQTDPRERYPGEAIDPHHHRPIEKDPRGSSETPSDTPRNNRQRALCSYTIVLPRGSPGSQICHLPPDDYKYRVYVYFDVSVTKDEHQHLKIEI